MTASGVAAAYSATGAAWQSGPARIYDRLAEVVVGWAAVPLAGAAGLDLGAGTGAAGKALLGAGARRVVAVDLAVGMLAVGASDRPPGVAGDLAALPLRAGAVDVTVAAFSLNHLVDPAAGLREAARVTRPGGWVVAASYAADDAHPVKGAVEGALRERGWQPAPWFEDLRVHATPLLATVDGCRTALAGAGLHGDVEPLRVPFAGLGAGDLVAWRLGMAQHAPFVASLPTDADRAELAADAADRLGSSWPPLVRSVLVLRAPVG